MSIAPKLDLRQSQSLIMTPQLQQAIKLLQMSNLELGEFVEEELERNPLLERGEGEEGADDAEGGSPEAGEFTDDHNDGQTGDEVGSMDDGGQADDPAADGAADTGLEDRLEGGFEGAAEAPLDPAGVDLATSGDSLDAESEDVYGNDSPSEAPVDVSGGDMGVADLYGGGGYQGNDTYGVEQTPDQGISLKAHLLQQLNVEISDPGDLLIGANLIEQVDGAGYMREDLDDVAARFGTDVDRVLSVLEQLQAFDPVGVMARNLQECLALQLKEADRFDPAMQAFVENLDLLAKHDIDRLLDRCGVDREDLIDMIDEIKALNPKPGLIFDYEVAQPVVPDVYVRVSQTGGWAVELNTETLPRVLVNSRYFATVREKSNSKVDRVFLSDCMATANWLVKSLDQRARTILKVSSEIVRQQDRFLADGVAHLRPLNLRAIAEAIEMHESTVSRVTANKFMATPRGIFELKYFFTSAIPSSDGENLHSAEAVRYKIKELIEEESPSAILSDDKLVELLKKSDIVIARRTIAKYREAMSIPSSVQRRRQKRMKL